ncbi:MAG TPA: hypothetical protein VKX49_17065 [Bryobacteraceae bacterium]|nr:hypothetical protein [Bryobacteraceae bacterium]
MQLIKSFSLSAALFCSLVHAQNVFTIAGIPYTHRNSVDGQPALNAPLGSVYGLLVDKGTGRLLLHDEFLVLRLEPDNSLLAVAGIGPQLNVLTQLLVRPSTNGSPSTVPASTLQPGVLRGMAQDRTGALYLSDAAFGSVYRIGLDGVVSVFAGGGTETTSDGGPATEAALASPRGLVFDSQGNLDIAEVFCNCIRQVSPGGIISTLYTAPRSTVSGRVPNIEGLAIDAQDNLYFTEWFGNVVMKVAPNGTATNIAGTGSPGFSGDGGPAASAELNGPSGVTLDSNGNILVADTRNHRIRKITPDGTITTIAGTGTCGFSGDGGPALAAELCLPAQVLFDSSGNLLISDYGNRRVRAIAPDSTIVTLAGSGAIDKNLGNPGSSGDGGPEIHATFALIGRAVFDKSGNLFVSDAQANNIRKISADGTVSTIAGTGQSGYSGDGGPALQAQLLRPGPVSVGPDGALYVITGDSRVRKITPDGIIHLVAGTGTGTGLVRDQGDGGPAVQATLNEPGAVAFDQQGNIYIADTSNARIRKIDSNGIINTIGPVGQQGADYYNSVAVDPHGTVYVAWTHALAADVYSTVNRINSDGSFTRVAGVGSCARNSGQFPDDGVAATQAHLCAVTSMTMGPDGLLYLSEGVYSIVLRINTDATIQRMAGNTAAIYPGDGGSAIDASLHGTVTFSPEAVTFDPTGAMFVPQPGLNLIRKVTSTSYAPRVMPDRIDAAGPIVQTLTVSANFAEPFPYQVRVSTDDGGSWVETNRTTGITGESLTVTIHADRLGHGTHHGTLAVLVFVPVGAPPIEVDVPISVTLP